MSIGDDDSEDRIHADWLLEEIIQPVFDEDFSEYRVERADRITIPGRIDAQVISALLDADLVIADLTTLNPNAFYEIGIRHMTQKPVIHMHLEGQRIPFDIASFRSIKFSRARPRDLKAARAALKDAIEAAVRPDHKVDNPVTFARGKVDFAEDATPRERVLQEQIDDLRFRVNSLVHERYEPEDINLDRKNTSGIPNLRVLVKTKKEHAGQVERTVDKAVRGILQDYLIGALDDGSVKIDMPDDTRAKNSLNKLLSRIRAMPYVEGVEVIKE
ncbi:hypothetical protein ABID26_005967 [Mesorhizobium shonense]|uniref:Uncharacterized protein n=1 Tax=Mesorhizobium shonense TaxID=1209948 RepID=A0ABV2I109_9HYPH